MALNLKNEIDKLNLEKNNLIPIKKEINVEITSLGETEASTYFEIPSKLGKAMKSCVKTANISLNHKYTFNNNSDWRNITIPVGLAFEPQIIHFEFEATGYRNQLLHAHLWGNSEFDYLKQTVSLKGVTNTLDLSVLSANNKEVTFRIRNGDAYTHVLIFKQMVIIGK